MAGGCAGSEPGDGRSGNRPITPLDFSLRRWRAWLGRSRDASPHHMDRDRHRVDGKLSCGLGTGRSRVDRDRDARERRSVRRDLRARRPACPPDSRRGIPASMPAHVCGSRRSRDYGTAEGRPAFSIPSTTRVTSRRRSVRSTRTRSWRAESRALRVSLPFPPRILSMASRRSAMERS